MESTLWFCYKCASDDGPIITLSEHGEKPIRRICRKCVLQSEALLERILTKLRVCRFENNEVLVAGLLSTEDFMAVAAYLPEPAIDYSSQAEEVTPK